MECNIDFIKWMCEKAEGFDLMNNGDDIFPDITLYYDGYGIDALAGDIKKRVQFQHLLTKAIEGINREDGCYSIRQDWLGCSVFQYRDIPWDNFDNNSPEETKEAVLKYIYEQEKK